MDYRMKFARGLLAAILLALIVVPSEIFARNLASASEDGKTQRYIVILDDLPLAAYDGRVMATPERANDTTRLLPTSNRFTGALKLDVKTPRSKAYLHFLDERYKAFNGEATLRLGRRLKADQRYRNATNGFATGLTDDEVRALRDVPGVKAVLADEIQHLETDSGPNWIGADKIHEGSAGFTATGGEGIAVGLIDTGVNFGHPSFADPGEGGGPGWDHVNPYASQLGLCSDPDVACNDKLVGVYDFVEDDPSTTAVEKNTKGLDDAGHGSHTGSTVAGNPLNVTISGVSLSIGGVAPNANIVSYRVCYIADPDVEDSEDGCSTSAILSAIDQAISDQVDVINFSIGSSASNPWANGSDTRAFLNARAAGIFVATSAGNDGPNAGSIGSPANAPWTTAVGAATHDRVFGNSVENLSGGDTPPPGDLLGKSFTAGIGIRKIVHAKDFGNALCGTGASESQPDCADNTGASNPFGADTFHGEIVVCDRGTYGRVEKGKNLLLAGAGGYILANTDSWGEELVADNHCLPAVHIGAQDGNALRQWLDSGMNHQGSISGFTALHDDGLADELASFSARGPNLPPVADIMKPDLIAPGVQILAANVPSANSFGILDGTSMSSPHVTGGAALLKAVHPDWTPAMIASALVMTATPELAHDFDGSGMTVHKRGAGRPRLDQAANAGLFLDETKNNFLAANPQQGGEPRDLNLPGLVDTQCINSCSLQRTVTDMAGGSSWTASAEGFDEGTVVNISPQNFTLADAASRLLTITVDLSQAGHVGSWVYGNIRLKSDGKPDAVMPVAVFADGGKLPAEWQISTDQASGWQEFALDKLVAMPDATFMSAGLVEPTLTIQDLPQDPSNDSPYDDSDGLLAIMLTVPADTLWLHTETLPSTANDLDLFVGLDSNHDGFAQQSEELCSSTTPTDLELCDLFTPVAGDYWVIVQNWDATNDPDEVTLKTAVIGRQDTSALNVSGSGIVGSGENFNLRLSWDNVNAEPGDELIGAVGIGTDRETPNNIGIVPVRFTLTAVAAPETLALMNGHSRTLNVDAGGTHDRIYIDVPPAADSLTVTASGTGSEENDNLAIELYRMDFDEAFTTAPFAAAPDTSGEPIAASAGSGGSGPELTVSGGQLLSGRWYVVLTNQGSGPASVEVHADIVSSADPIALRGGLWQPSSRPDLRQGYDFNTTGGFRAMLWYTYDEDGKPEWYLASGPEPTGNTWVAELLRYTNDGSAQHSVPAGYVSVTTLSEDDAIFSFVLFGQSGSDRMSPNSPPLCPSIDSVKRSYTGIWSRPVNGVGGASVLVNATSQAFVHYIYDDKGDPRWLIASPDPQSPTSQEMALLQFAGYCAVCDDTGVTLDTVGVFSREFSDESNVSWTLDYLLNAPLSGSINRTDEAVKLTVPIQCQ